ncbi:hypothetical protein [Dokdonella sp.]|uniref:hypothetical protein n=1 Tax=Dokdonella sp. TaxID=2291710 RepID=UPI002F42E7D2
MKMKSTSAWTLSLLLVAGACAAQVSPSNPPATNANDEPTRGAAMTSDASWDGKDTNKDGYITKEELKGDPALLTHFDAIDTDHDMKLSPAEWKAWGHGEAGRR